MYELFFEKLKNFNDNEFSVLIIPNCTENYKKK